MSGHNPERDTTRLRELVTAVPEAFARARQLESAWQSAHLSGIPSLDPLTVARAQDEARSLALEMACLADLELTDSAYPSQVRTA